jgi:hypothetical protein
MGTTIEVSDNVMWGKYVKSLATGKNYIKPGEPSFPLPRTLDELHKTAKSIGLTIKLPDAIVGLSVIQYSPQTAVIKLASKETIEKAEAALREPDAVYPMPTFYDDFYRKKLPPMAVDKRLELHAARIGDICVRNCG